MTARETEVPSVPRGTNEVQRRVTGEEGRSSPREAGGGSVDLPPPASVSEEADRKAAYRWVAMLITKPLHPEVAIEWPLPQRVWLEVLEIRDAMERAGRVPLSPTLETESAGAVPAPESAAGAPPAVPPAPPLPAPEEPGIHGVSCDEVAAWVNGDYSGAVGERLRALEDHLHDCEGSCRGVAALRAFERRMG